MTLIFCHPKVDIGANTENIFKVRIRKKLFIHKNGYDSQLYFYEKRCAEIILIPNQFPNFEYRISDYSSHDMLVVRFKITQP